MAARGRPVIRIDFPAEVLEAYRNHHTDHYQLAAAYGLSPQTVRRELRRAGLEVGGRRSRTRGPGTPPVGPAPARPVPGSRNARIAERYEAGQTLQEIAGEYGLTAEGVRQILLHHGVFLRSPGFAWKVFGPDGRPADMEGLAARLRSIRLVAGLSQRELAERSGVAERTVRFFERARIRPRWETLVRLAKVLAVDLETAGIRPKGGSRPAAF